MLVTKGTDTSLGTTVTPHLSAAPISYSGPTSDGKQPGATETVAITARQGSYVDVQFRPSTGSFTLDLGTLGDEITFAGFGGTGVTVVPGGVTDLGGGLYRFLLTGTFRPGLVDVVFHFDNFGDTSARGPPAGSTETQSFLVTGSTGDVTSTTPSTPTTPEKTIGLSGAAIGRDLINGRHYIEITFRPSEGFSLDNATIDGGEIQLRDASGNLIALASPVRVGLTNTYRYAFLTDLGIGKYTIAFVAGSFGDTGGTLNLAESEEFTVASPIAALADPIRGQIIDAKDFNGRGYVDITFTSFHENAVDAATIRDAGAEITITAGGTTLTVLGTPAPRQRLHLPLLLHRPRLRRPGRLVHRRQLGQHRRRRRGARSRRPSAASCTRRPSRRASRPTSPRRPRSRAPGSTSPSPRSPAPRWMPRASSPARGRPTASSPSPAPGPRTSPSSPSCRSNATTFRYLFTGTLTPGTVNVTFRAGSWWDSEGNRAAGGTSSFRLITQGTSFFIELSGGIRLEAAGLTSEPLIDLKAEVVLEIDTARKLFTLTFAGQLSIYKLGTVGATSGRFVLDMGDGLSSVPQFWGVATLETNFTSLEQYGLHLFAKGTLQINLTGVTRTETLTLRGLGEGGTDLTRTFVLNPYSFGLELVGQAIVKVPDTDHRADADPGRLLPQHPGRPHPGPADVPHR